VADGSQEQALEPSFADGPPTRFDAEGFREVMARFASGVTVVTTRIDGADVGTTASAFTSLSLEPPMALVCLFRGAGTERAIAEVGRFGINILREGQGHLAERFASRAEDRFDQVDFSYGELGVPLLGGALAHIECKVAEQVLGGTHTVFLGEATRAVAYDGHPLAYYRGSFGHFMVGTSATAHAALRADIVSGEHPPGGSLEVAALAARYETEPPAVIAALRHLVEDGYVVRGPGGSYLVRTPDRRLVLDMIGTRRAIEVGAAAAAIDWVESEEIDRWSGLASAPCSACPGGAGNLSGPDFHSQMVEFSRNQRLCEHFREVSLARLAAMYPLDEEADGDCTDDHLAIVDAYRSGSLPSVVAAVDKHARRLRNIWSAALD